VSPDEITGSRRNFFGSSAAPAVEAAVTRRTDTPRARTVEDGVMTWPPLKTAVTNIQGTERTGADFRPPQTPNSLENGTTPVRTPRRLTNQGGAESRPTARAAINVKALCVLRDLPPGVGSPQRFGRTLIPAGTAGVR